MQPLWYRHRQAPFSGVNDRPWSPWLRFDRQHPSGRLIMVQETEYQFTDVEPFIPGWYINSRHTVGLRPDIKHGSVTVVWFEEQPESAWVRVRMEVEQSYAD